MATESPTQHSLPTDPHTGPSLDISELGPRGRAVIEWIRAAKEPVVVTHAGRALARLVPVQDVPSDSPVVWDVESMAP